MHDLVRLGLASQRDPTLNPSPGRPHDAPMDTHSPPVKPRTSYSEVEGTGVEVVLYLAGDPLDDVPAKLIQFRICIFT